MEWYITILIIAAGIFFHELGHIVVNIRQKRKFKVKFIWWGIEIEDKDIYSTTPYNMVFVYSVGIMSGLPFFSLIEDGILIYALVCMLDIVGIIYVFNFPKSDRRLTYKQLIKKEYKKVWRK